MNITKFYEDYHIEYLTQGNKHCTSGWVNIHCPFCSGSQNYHLGYNLTRNYYKCWRCGFHKIVETIQKLTGLNKHEAHQIIKQYGGKSPLPKSAVTQVKRKKFKYPHGTDSLQNNHKRYLEKRRFDPDKLEHEWGLLGTGPAALLDTINYSHRILAPIYFQNKIVSFQTRAITDKTELKYLACPKAREKIHHKHILYGLDKCVSNTGVLVEGITDVWRLGPGAVNCFGIGWKLQQMKLLAKQFDRIIILFDDDPQAIQQAKLLEFELTFRGKKVIRKTIKGDPGDMKQDDADYFMKGVKL